MKRTNIFSKAVDKPKTIRDARFGIRNMKMNPQVSPSVFTYATPGKGPNGEHQT